MQSLLVTFLRRALVLLIFSGAFTFALATSTPAQTAADAERARQMADRDQAAREWALRNIGKVRRVDVEVEPMSVPLAKVKEDYERLQSANNGILKMLSRKELDYKVIADASSEIRKRAGRLNSYLVSLKIVEDDKERKRSLDEIEPAEMKASLLSLDASITSFISSPVFKDFGKVVDADSSAKARANLDSIIDLSERIKRSADRSMKSTRASR